ncbi:hypothetical protein [Tropicimonas sediminicola]|uniref:Uncharacterized protein n=1 Tax=Tropicimonas sediminicola TaxID=1031541 RepID=A0A239GSB6_9RHOB|nr:hypothetical protein [Tropicimonas sediminicola]SNS72099.1 hypothetical protein SAMN05421757_10387 [Tropicimonas sediminicola]
MKNTLFRMTGAALAVGLALTTAGGPVAAEETLVGTNVDSRVVLGFAAPEAAVEEWLPDGYGLVTLPRGPMAGTNVLLVLIDRHLRLEADGTPAEPFAAREAVLASFAMAEGGKPQLFATRIYATDATHDPFGISVAATIGRKSGLDGSEGESRVRSEDWVIAPEGGGQISVRYSHVAGMPVWSEGKSTAFSATTPTFHRIFHYRQLDDVAMSEGLGKTLDGTVEISIDVPELADMFDGSERLVAIISRPVYERQVFAPGE